MSGMLTNFSEKSWLRFQVCAKRPNDVIWARMKGFWEEGPKGKYHRRCYQVYTDKVKVARAVEKQRHILIEDPLEDNDSDDSITEPPQQNGCQGPRLMHLTYTNVYLSTRQNNAKEE